jgi:hypothetical protein
MKNLLLVLLTIPLLFDSCKKDDDDGVVPNSSNTWTKTFGGTGYDFGNSVQQTTDGGYIITGGTESFGNGNGDVYLVKTDENGDSLWTKTFGGTGSEVGYSVQQTTDGGYIITGETDSFGNGNKDVYLIKTEGNGVLQWSKTFGETGDDGGKSVQQTTDGGYIISGSVDTFGNGYSDVYLVKTDENGVEQWNKVFGGFNRSDMGFSVQQTTDGGFIITGTFCSSGDCPIIIGHVDTDVYLVKTDENGVLQWSKTFGGTGSDVGHSVQQTTDGGFIITGWTDTSDVFNYNKDVYLIKTDGNGDEQWNKTLGVTTDTYSYSVQQTTDGGYILSGGSINDVYLVKTDENGDSLWTKTFGGTGSEVGYSVQQTTDGGYIITGNTDSFGNGYYDVYLIKTDENGDVNP